MSIRPVRPGLGRRRASLNEWLITIIQSSGYRFCGNSDALFEFGTKYALTDLSEVSAQTDVSASLYSIGLAMAHHNIMTAFGKDTESGQPNDRAGVFLFERRRHPRINIELPFDLSLVEKGESYSGLVEDVSEGGLLVYLLEKIEIGALLRMDIFVAKGIELFTIKAIAEVVWSDLATEKSWAEYRYGIKFLSFFKEDLGRLKTLLKEVARA